MDVHVLEVRGLNKEQTVCMHHLSKQLPSFTHLPSYIAENPVMFTTTLVVCVCVSE